MSSCTLCGADWSSGAFTPDCPECDGGAMERPCLLCGGKCGSPARRAVQDSQDQQVGVWLFRCAGPPRAP